MCLPARYPSAAKLPVKGGARWAISVFARRSACRSGSRSRRAISAQEGLDYEFIETAPRGTHSESAIVELADRSIPQVMQGAFESLESGRACDVSMACHWAVNMASSASHGKMWGHAYMLNLAGIMVPPESPIRRPEDLRGVEIAVGYHSGSHFSCLQYLQTFIPPKEARLSFGGSTNQRLDELVDRKVPAGNMWGVERDILEQLGFRKIVDTTYMQGFLLDGSVDTADCWKYFRALQRAQHEIDAHPEQYKEYYWVQVADRYKDQVDVRGFSNGRRIVFEPYTREVYESTHDWLESIEIFPADQLGHATYEEAILV